MLARGMLLTYVLRLLRLFILALLVVLGVLMAATHGLLCCLRLSRPAGVHGFARLWYRSLLAVMNIHVRLDKTVPMPARGLIAANHLTWLDIPVLGSVLPTYFLSKAELLSVPLVGWLAKRGGTVFIHRGRHQLREVREVMQTRLENGHFLTFFPEATTGPGHRLRPFHPRLFSAAIETGLPVIPVAIHYRGEDPVNPKIPFCDEHFFTNVWRILGIWRTQVDVQVLPALQSAGMARRPLANMARAAVAESLNLPLDPAPPGFPVTTPENRA